MESAHTVRERPILMSGPMVRAILDGRKTQTRRVVKDATGTFWDHRAWLPEVRAGSIVRWVTVDGANEFGAGAPLLTCPYGVPGDRLWVRETFFEEYDPITCKPYDPPRAIYAATHEGEVRKMDGDGGDEYRKDGTQASPWRPSIFMPRWASRITLEVTEVRVQRVKDITEDDAAAEGVIPNAQETDGIFGAYSRAYSRLWDSLNAKRGYGWDANPWVWAITFGRSK